MTKTLVWDRFVRFSHWTVAALFFGNYWFLKAGDPPHEWAGYTLIGLIVIRLIWGFVGSENARIVNFFPTVKRLRTYLSDYKQPLDAKQGHNPVGALMILFLWLMLLLTGVTGWMQTTDLFWGEDWVQELHDISSQIVLYAIAVHVSAIIVISHIKNIELIQPMITGWRRGGKE